MSVSIADRLSRWSSVECELFEGVKQRRVLDAPSALQEVPPDRGRVDRSSHANKVCSLVRDLDEDATFYRAAAEESAVRHARELMGQPGAIPSQQSAKFVLTQLPTTELD